MPKGFISFGGPFTVQSTAASALAAYTSFSVNGAAYIGFLDQYPSLGATWGFSNFKLQNASNGNNSYFIQVTRASDSTTQNIGWDVNSKASVATFNSFCSGTTCAATTIYDQINGSNATCSNVVAFVGTDSRVDLAPGPGGTCSVAYSSTFSTVKQELFATVYAAYSDFRLAQSGLPGVTVTGNLSTGSTTIASMSSQAGISATNNLFAGGGATGITDSASLLPTSSGNTQAYLASFPSGSTATISFYDGSVGTWPSGSQTGDSLTFTNAVLGGSWIGQGPSSSGLGSAYWAMGLGPATVDGDICDPIVIRNAGVLNSFNNVIGEGQRGILAVWDMDTSTGITYYDGTQVTSSSSATNVTYSTNVGLTLFNSANSTSPTQNQVFEMMVLVDQTYSGRATAGSWLMTQAGITAPPTSITTGDGFTWTPYYSPNDAQYTSVYGRATTSADAFGLTWTFTDGGYAWPSVSFATNVNNSTTLKRFIVEPGDSDVNITGAERGEIAASNATVAPGQSFSEYDQLDFVTFPSQSTASGNWCDTNQIHNNNVDNTAPDMISIQCNGGNLQFVYQNMAGDNTETTYNCGSAISIPSGTWINFEIDAFWSTNHTSDTLVIYEGNVGSNMTQVCNLTAQYLWDEDTGAYLKQGIYRGDHLQNKNTVELRAAATQWSNTAGAFDSLRTGTNQPATPTN